MVHIFASLKPIFTSARSLSGVGSNISGLVQKLTNEELYNQADLVVSAVPAQREIKIKDDRQIWTYVTLRVQQYIKGWGPEECQVAFPGGVSGSHGQTTGEIPSLRPDTLIVAFLKWNHVLNAYVLVGGEQGVKTQ